MRAVIQRVANASVTVDGAVVGAIGQGLLVLLAVGAEDGDDDVKYIADKVPGLRIFNDDAGKFDRSLQDVGGAILAVSQFTLYGDCRKGRRPSFTEAAPPEAANALYEAVVERWRAMAIPVQTGLFRAHMDVALVNDGPVTLILDSKRL